MKFSYLFLFISLFSLISCNNLIKNDNAKVEVEEGTQVETTTTKNTVIGNYVGDFVPDYGSDKDDSIKYSKDVYAGEAFQWNRENKISISIDELKDGKAKGHSVVAGNEQTFEGEYCTTDSGFHFTCKEPGNDKHDGTFTFTIQDTLLKGKWKAFAKIDIQNRKYDLVKRDFMYNPNFMIDTNEYGSGDRFIDWTKPSMRDDEIKKLKSKMTKEEREMYEDFEEDTDFASATDNIFKINASTTLLKEAAVANMKRGDIYILRNTIYARHGYSFKYRPLRVFFDKQNWYVPFTANIKNEFTEIEKQNIQLLLKYEKNAKEFYDSFGRG